MKIAEVKAHLVHTAWRKNWIFVKVETDEGIHGWGEAYTQYDRDRSIAIHVEELARYLTGRSPFDIKHHTTMAFDDYAKRRGSVEFFSALSAIEQALWDIVGKANNQPIYNLLGGKYRNRIRVYANGWSYGMTTPKDFAAAAAKAVERGFTALKFDPIPSPQWRTYIPRGYERTAIDVVREIRSAVGPDVDLLIELHRRLAPMHAIRLAKRLEEFDPFWLEEPCLATNLDALESIRATTEIPVVTGEALYTKADFRPVFEKSAADIINPDVCNVGGILELKEIAAMAEPYFIAVAPHNYNSTVLGLAATVQASVTMQNFLITEYFLPFEELGSEVCPNVLQPERGYLTIPEAPGIGVTIDEKALAKHPFRQFKERRLPTYEGEAV